MGQGRRHDIAAAAEDSAAVAQPDRWKPRACQLLVVMDLRPRNIRGPGGQVGPVLKGIRDQIVGGGVQCDQVDRDERSPRGAEADRGVEIEPVGQSSGRDGDGLLGALDGGPAQLPVGLGAVGVGRSPLTGDREVVDDHRKVVALALGQALGIEDRLVGQQLEMQKRHVQKYLVGGCQGGEARPDHALMGRQRFEPGLRHRPDDIDHGYRDRAGSDGARTAAEVE